MLAQTWGGNEGHEMLECLIYSAVIIHAAITSLNVRKKKYSLFFDNRWYYHMWPTDEGFIGSFMDFEAQASRHAF